MILNMDTKFMNVNYVYSTFVIQLIKKNKKLTINFFVYVQHKQKNESSIFSSSCVEDPRMLSAGEREGFDHSMPCR